MYRDRFTDGWWSNIGFAVVVAEGGGRTSTETRRFVFEIQNLQVWLPPIILEEENAICACIYIPGGELFLDLLLYL
jgi:hypothetical protein